MNSTNVKSFIRATIIRAVRTFAESMLAYIGAAKLLSDVNWLEALSAGCFGAILSVLLAFATGLPEVNKTTDGGNTNENSR